MCGAPQQGGALAGIDLSTQTVIQGQVWHDGGPEVSDALLSVLPLLGEWHGEGVMTGAAAGEATDHRFGQWIRFSHDGRGFLAYESRSWLLTDDGVVTGPGAREAGFWRPRGDDDV